MTIRFGSKVPGTSMEVRDVTMDFAYGESFTESSPEAYERLILDVLLGDANLFPRHQEVELSWKILDPIEEYWDEARQARAVPAGTWGPAEARRDARTRRTELAAAMNIDLTDTTSSKINAALVKARRAIGTPAMGMVLTLVIVTDEADHYDALKAASDASTEHPSRILVVIKRVGRSRATGRRPGSTPRSGSAATPGSGETVVLRLHGELADHAQSVVLPLLLPDAPVVVWWPEDAPAEPRQGPAGPAGPAPHHRRRRGRGPGRRARPARRRATHPATPTWPGPGSPRGAACWPPRWTSSTAPITRRWSRARSTTRAANCWRCGSPSGCGSRSSARLSEGPGLTAVRLETAERRDLPGPRRRRPGRARRSRASRTGTSRSSGGSTAELIAEELRRLDPDETYASSA